MFLVIKNIFIKKNLTDFRKTVEAGVDPPLNYTAHERHSSCLLVPFFFFSFVIILSVLDAFFLVLSEDPVDDVETQSADHKYR